MSERKSRIEELLEPRTRPEPPPDLLDSIRQEIPERIGSGETRRRFRGAWLVAAVVVLVAGGGWLTVTLLRAPDHRTVADGSLAVRQSETFELAPAATEPAAPAEDFVEPGREQQTSTREVPARVADEFEEPLRAEPPPAPVIAQAAPRPAAESPREDSDLSFPGFSPEPPPPPPVVAPAAPGAPPPPPAPAETRDRVRVASEESLRVGAQEDAADVATAKVARETAVAATVSAPEAAEKPRPDRSEAVAEPERDHAPSWDAIREHLERGELPPAEVVDPDELISRFDYGDSRPRRSRAVSLFIEGGAARIDPIRRKTVRVGIRSAAGLRGPAATEATLLVDFDPDVVALYRRIGTDSERRPGEEAEPIEIGEIGSDRSHSWLFEVHLLPDTRLDQVMATARLRYLPPKGDVPTQIVHNLNVGHVGRHTSSRSVRTAALAGAWAELLAGIRPEISLADLTREAEDLSRLGGEPAELARLVRDTVRIIGR
jgi:hypothetical protein